MIRFDEMPSSAQKAYKVTNTVRKAALFIGWAIFVLAFILSIKNSEGIKSTLMAAFVSAGIFPGMIHGEFAYKKAITTLKNYLGPLGFFIGLGIACFLFTIFYVFGFIFPIIDTILFILKKPLIYPFENRCFLETRKAQEEIAAEAYNELLRAANSDDAMTKLQKLKDMMEQGIITEEEFIRKKAELLEEI